MSSPGGKILAHIDAVVAVLRKAGFRFFSPWWRETAFKFYGGRWKRLVLRCGRRSGKSKFGELVAVLEMLFGEHDIPAGDVGYFAFVSVNRDEAAQRIRSIKMMLDALGQAYTATADTVELIGTNRGAKVFTRTVAGTSGFTCVGLWFDEMAKAAHDDSSAAPAEEVLASMVAMCATMPNARIFLASSPMTNEDAHAKAFDRGDDEYQMTAFAATWTANPTISEEATRSLEPDEKRRLREYAGLCQDGESSALDSDLVRAAVRPRPPLQWTGAPALFLDPSSGRHDRFTWAHARWSHPATETKRWVRAAELSPTDERFDLGVECQITEKLPWSPPFLEVVNLGGWHPPMTTRADEIGAALISYCRKNGIRRIFSDQREAFLWSSIFSAAGLAFKECTWTNTSKLAAMDRIRGWFRDGQILLPKHDRLISELCNYSERITASGATVYGARNGQHDDYAALLMTAAMADLEGSLSGSPLGKRISRNLENLPMQ